MKKKRTIKQQKNHYRKLQYASKAGEYAAVVAPFGVMFAVNFNEWINVEGGWKIGLGGTLAMGLMTIAITLVGKTKDKSNTIATYVTLLLTWLATAFILTLLSQIIQEVANLMFIASSGIASALGLEVVRVNCQKKADNLKADIEKAKSEINVSEAKEELVAEKEKKGIKF